MSVIVAIDPGVTGAIAFFAGGVLEGVDDMPVFDARVDGGAIASMLRSAEPDLVVVENTQPMPRNGSISSFKLGLNTGIVIGAIQAEGFPLRRIRPVDWKRGSGLIGKPKDASRGLAVELFPRWAHLFRLVKHHNRAEAALIGRFAVYHEIHADNAVTAPDKNGDHEQPG